MNLLIRKTGLLLIGAVLFLFSCDRTSELLLDPGTDSNKIGTYYLDTFTINSSQVILAPDSFSTRGVPGGSANNWLLVGERNDSYMGSIKAKSFTETGWVKPTFSSTAEYQSFKIHLDFDYKYGGGGDDLNFSIYELSDTLDSRKLYNSNEEASIKSFALAVAKITRSDADKIKGVEINLSDSRGLELFNDLKNFPNDTSRYFKGIALVPESGNTSVWGADPDSSYIDLTFKEDTVVKVARLPIGYLGKFTHIETTKVLNPTYSYVQSSTGLATRISFPSLTNINQQNRKIAINKAILVIEPEDDPGISPPSNLFLLAYPDNNFLYDQDVRFAGNYIYPNTNYKATQSAIRGIEQILNTSAVNLFYSSATNTYSADITSYIEALLNNVDNRFPNNDLLLYSEAPGQIVNKYFSYSVENGQRSFNKDMSINRAVIQKEKIKLKIYYTLVP